MDNIKDKQEKIEQYFYQLKSLLPLGRAWELSPNHLLLKILRAVAAVLIKFEEEKERALAELFVKSPDVLLPDWERYLGIKTTEGDKSININTGNQLRQIKLRHYFRRGEVFSNRQYFENYCQDYGYVVTEIREFRPFMAGVSSAGEVLSNGRDWARHWIIEIDLAKSTPLVNKEFLEQQLQSIRPGHSILKVSYINQT
ncbi:MAG: DUF2313 domain-containing protein [Oligoflexia bacterium]|nr:DUF2313 domain-containing protein [Oligoflexia bacterium]